MTGALDSPHVRTSALLTALVLAAGGVLWHACGRPLERELQGRQRELAGLRTASGRVAGAAGGLSRERLELQGLRARMEERQPMLPVDRDVDRVLQHVRLLAEDAGLNVLSVSPVSGADEPSHAERALTLYAEGNFGALLRFLDAVAAQTVILHIPALIVRAAGSGAPGVTISIECTVATLVMRDPSGDSDEGIARRRSGGGRRG